jgi:tetratricopeptide (TPR) repeat protein
LWDYNDPQATEARFQALLPRAREAGDHCYLAQLLTQIARAQGLQGKFDAAHATLDGAQSLLRDGHPVARIRYLLERGRVFNSSQRATQAREFFHQAWDLARHHGEDYYAVDAAHMMGIVEPPDRQLEWSERALHLATRSKQPRAREWLGPLYNNIGWTYHDLRRYDEALIYFRKALEWRQRQGQPRETRIAAWTFARGLRSVGRYEEALEIQRDNLRQAESGGEQDGFIQEEIAECLLALGRREEAREHYARAYEELSEDPWLKQNEPARLQRLRDLSG